MMDKTVCDPCAEHYDQPRREHQSSDDLAQVVVHPGDVAEQKPATVHATAPTRKAAAKSHAARNGLRIHTCASSLLRVAGHSTKFA